MKPLIGITSNYFNSLMPKLERGGAEELAELEKLKASKVASGMYALNEIPVNLSFQTDVAAIEAAGGIPVVLPLYQDIETAKAMLERVDGLLFAGGSDLGARWYGEDMVDNSGLFGRLDGLDNKDAAGFATEIIERDMMEMDLIRFAVNETKLPILGICRGAQVLNVAFGGTLFQDNKAATDFNHSQFATWDQESHPIKLVEGTILHDVFGRKDLKVNSLHHQSVKEVGQGLRVSSLAPDGVVESIEHKDTSRFIVGIQWHPEMLRVNEKEQDKVFDAFLQACKKA